jgi:hypothetical protein
MNRTILNGYAGVEGWDQPNEFLILVDGEEVFSAKVGGKDDHEASSKDAIDMIAKLEERLKKRVFVTAGPHEVVFTWRERPFQPQDVWQVSQRDTQEVHLAVGAGGLPRLRFVTVTGPYNAKGVSNTPSRERIFVCRPASAAEEPACAQRILSTLARRAYRRPVTAADVDAPMAFYRQERESGGKQASARAWRASWRAPGSCIAWSAIRRPCASARRTGSATSSSHRASRSSSGAAFRTRSSSGWRPPAGCASRACWRRRCAA